MKVPGAKDINVIIPVIDNILIRCVIVVPDWYVMHRHVINSL